MGNMITQQVGLLAPKGCNSKNADSQIYLWSYLNFRPCNNQNSCLHYQQVGVLAPRSAYKKNFRFAHNEHQPKFHSKTFLPHSFLRENGHETSIYAIVFSLVFLLNYNI